VLKIYLNYRVAFTAQVTKLEASSGRYNVSKTFSANKHLYTKDF